MKRDWELKLQEGTGMSAHTVANRVGWSFFGLLRACVWGKKSVEEGKRNLPRRRKRISALVIYDREQPDILRELARKDKAIVREMCVKGEGTLLSRGGTQFSRDILGSLEGEGLSSGSGALS